VDFVSDTANPPKSDDRYAQLTRGALIINDFLQNPHIGQTFGQTISYGLKSNLWDLFFHAWATFLVAFTYFRVELKKSFD
jgi:hypothetical protein